MEIQCDCRPRDRIKVKCKSAYYKLLQRTRSIPVRSATVRALNSFQIIMGGGNPSQTDPV
jgi:hypothetical protein